jgi:hypothetical protein
MRKGGQLNAITHSTETFYGSKRVRGCLAHGEELSVYIVVIRYCGTGGTGGNNTLKTPQ